MKPLIAGNWKMNCSLDDAKRLIADIINGVYEDDALQAAADIMVFPSFLHMSAVRHALANHSLLAFGGQDCSAHDDGAHTGDISARMLSDSGCSAVIVGHSERRVGHTETSSDVNEKVRQIHANKMVAVVCVGETLEDREAERAEEIVQKQLQESLPASVNASNTIIAYEPVWAIGTGKTPSNGEIRMMHGHIRGYLEEKLADAQNLRILYGGSVKPDNAADILKINEVNGALVGGASLDADSFLGIAKAITG